MSGRGQMRSEAVTSETESGLFRLEFAARCAEGTTSRSEVIMPITIYGIKNCDTMKKVRAWLDKHGVDNAFHDYKIARSRESGKAGRRTPAQHVL